MRKCPHCNKSLPQQASSGVHHHGSDRLVLTLFTSATSLNKMAYISGIWPVHIVQSNFGKLSIWRTISIRSMFLSVATACLNNTCSFLKYQDQGLCMWLMHAHVFRSQRTLSSSKWDTFGEIFSMSCGNLYSWVRNLFLKYTYAILK